MIDKITQLIQQISGSELANAGIDSSLGSKVTEQTADSILSGLKNSLASGDLASVTSLFSDKAQDLGSNTLVQGIIAQLVQGLTSKLGLSSSTADSFAHGVVPQIIQAITAKSGQGEKGFELTDLLGSLGGNSSSGILGALGGDKSQVVTGALGALKGLFK